MNQITISVDNVDLSKLPDEELDLLRKNCQKTIRKYIGAKHLFIEYIQNNWPDLKPTEINESIKYCYEDIQKCMWYEDFSYVSIRKKLKQLGYIKEKEIIDQPEHKTRKHTVIDNVAYGKTPVFETDKKRSLELTLTRNR